MVRVLQVTTHDVTVKKLLLPLIDRLAQEGYEVTTACRPGRYTPELLAQGYSFRAVDMDRHISARDNVRTLMQLRRLMRQEQPDIVHVHTPVAAALGRVAAQLASVPVILYTAHGFYFHERMGWRSRTAYTWIEKVLGRVSTDFLFTQSQEDAATAVRQGICPNNRVMWISNGVDVRRFNPGPPDPALKAAFGLPPTAPVVGFIGRMVAEKGVLELLDAFQEALAVIPDLYLLMAGDITDGDRDIRTREIIRSKVESKELAPRVVFTGFVEDITRVMGAIDLFVLPSHREGMPRSIIEAMASGKPVVATDIRGCREEVVHEVTGLLVPVRDSQALARAMIRILSDPSLASRMGAEGRRRAEDLFDEADVLERQVRVYRQLVKQRFHQEAPSESYPQASEVQSGDD